MSDSPTNWDCVVLGAAHAGLCAALSAKQSGCKSVLVVDKCPLEWAGGNGYFTAGAIRTAHGGLKDLIGVVRNAPEDAEKTIELASYTELDFASDIQKMADNRSDKQMVNAVVQCSRATVDWLAQLGVPFLLSFNRQAYKVDGKHVFWGGLALSTENGGKGLIAALQQAVKAAGIELWYESPAIQIVGNESGVSGAVVLRDGKELRLESANVILATGGFEANPVLRAKHLGEGWERARVRGTPYNTGDGIGLATSVGAALTGDWSGCHSTCWDANTSVEFGDRILSNQYTKSGYPLGIMVNTQGERFVDEGEDFRNYTYAKFGRAILNQPSGLAFQLWDSQTTGWLRKEEYAEDVVRRITAQSIEELADKLVAEGLPYRDAFLQTVEGYNEAVASATENRKWDPSIKDGVCTHGHPLPKSNWALPITHPPFLAVKVACGITFTFGGVAIDSSTAGVIGAKSGQPIPGLFATGEVAGGLFYGNYPGGSGLTAGAVFGRKAGVEAGRRVARGGV